MLGRYWNIDKVSKYIKEHTYKKSTYHMEIKNIESKQEGIAVVLLNGQVKVYIGKEDGSDDKIYSKKEFGENFEIINLIEETPETEKKIKPYIQNRENMQQDKENQNESCKSINGYKIYKGGTWCEVTKNGTHIFSGVVDERMTIEQIYQEVLKEVVFSIKGKEVLSYDFLNEFPGERDFTIKQLAEDNNCDVKDIKVTIRKPELKKNILEIKFIGIDNWDRPVYKTREGKVFKDINLGKGKIELYTSANNDFYGEPDVPINTNLKIKLVRNFKKDKTRESSR